MKITSVRRAFTLVELLVVIAIMGVLMGLTIPAVQSVRASARQATCLNNEKQISTAMIAHDSTLGYLPFYDVYPRSNGTMDAGSWVIPLLPHLGESALWNGWESGEKAVSNLPYLICPDTPEKKNVMGALSYGANCGYEGQKNDDKSLGVYAFQLGALVGNPPNKRSMISKMKDGANYTVLASEKLEITTWQPKTREQNGILWNKTLTTDYYPSSRHPQKGFNTVFADGSARYLNRDVNYTLYCQIMAPDDKKASITSKVDLTIPMDTRKLGK